MNKKFFDGLVNNIFFLGETPSTNLLAKELALCCADGTTVIAEKQKNGSGRLGRSFFSPQGGVYLSYVKKLDGSEKNFSLLTLFAGLAAARATEHLSGIECKIKWCNDIYASDKKLGGILTLGVNDGDGHLSAAVIGIGINVLAHSDEFPSEIAERAASVYSLSGREIVTEQLAAEIIKELNRLLFDKALLTTDCSAELSEIRQRSVTIGCEVSVLAASGETIKGTAVGIADNGALIVNSNGEIKEISSGTLL